MATFDETDTALDLPWRVNPDEPRVICTSDWSMLGAMDTEDLARAVVETMNAGDVDARREVARLSTLVEHYRHRGEMTVSERQGYLGETVEQSIQPENRYHQRYIEPVKTLRATLTGILDVDATPPRSPSEALAALREAMEQFNTETRDWFW